MVSLEETRLQELIRDFTRVGANMQTSQHQRTILHAKCILAEAFSDFLLADEAGQPSKSLPKWFQEMLNEMDRLPNIQLGYPRMLELAPCSPNHLCRVFKAAMNQTPTDYINQKRLDYSVYYLTQTSDDVFRISENCGFNNLSHFYHLFKKRYHCSPVKFRKENRRQQLQ